MCVTRLSRIVYCATVHVVLQPHVMLETESWENKVGYTATHVACSGAGAAIKKVDQKFEQEQ